MIMRRISGILLASALALMAGTAVGANFSDNEIRIAILTGMHGISGPGSIVGAEMAAEEMGNEVLGRPIRIIPVDHKEDVEHALAEAERLRKELNVDAFADMIGSDVAIAVQKYATEHNIAVLQTTSATTKLTDELCSPVAVHWNYNSYAVVTGAARAVLNQGLNEWFFVSVDYALGEALTADAKRVLDGYGGQVLGHVRHPFRTANMREELRQAQASGAQVVALANAGADGVTAIRDAYEIGLIGSEQRVLALFNTVSTIQSLGVYATSGLIFGTGFYWNFDDQTRLWTERFMERMGHVPNMHHASTYSAVLHYLKAVEAAGTDEPRAAVAKMKELTPDDLVFRNSKVRPDGRMVHDMYLVQVKPAAEMTARGDYLEMLQVIPSTTAFRSLEESKCPLLKDGDS